MQPNKDQIHLALNLLIHNLPFTDIFDVILKKIIERDGYCSLDDPIEGTNLQYNETAKTIRLAEESLNIDKRLN